MKKSPFISFTIIFLVYVIAIYAGKIALDYLSFSNLYKEMLIADILATFIVFLFSFMLKNSSVYDPYWSVIPVPIALYWIFQNPDGHMIRQLIVLAVILIWSIRLTVNWIKSFPNLVHEDWRYKKLAEDTGNWYWLVSFLGIHLFPTLIVFAGMLPVLPAVQSTAGLTLFDITGALICILAVAIEYISDEQLRKFKEDNSQKGANMDQGLWSYTRHPNYLGEICFWLGLFIISLSAGIHETYWTGIGFLLMILLFKYISIPMMEKRLLVTKTDYDIYIKKVPALFPFLKKKRYDK